MRRRLPVAEPLAASAAWSRRCASVSASLALLAVACSRNGIAGERGGVALLALALLLAVLSIGLAAFAAVVIWRQGWRGIGQALTGCLLAAVVLVYPAYLVSKAVQLPDLNDVSTDLAAPPTFSTTPSARARRRNTVHEDPSPTMRDLQRKTYPGIQPVLLDVEPSEAFALALRLISARRWRVVEAVAPKGQSGTGHIDAVARTPVMAFPEDVTVRIRPQAGQTRVDLRSASRLARTDFGSNAERIEALTDDLQNAE